MWIQKVRDEGGLTTFADTESDTALIVEVENLEIHETRVEILDAYNELKLVALIEVVSPTNKTAGPGRVSYKAKQEETLARDCHLIEIDLLSRGRHVLCIPEWRVKRTSHSSRSISCVALAVGRRGTVSSFTRGRCPSGCHG